MESDTSGRTLEYTDQEDYWPMYDHVSNQPGGEGLPHYHLLDQPMPQQYLGPVPDPRYTTLPPRESVRYQDTSMPSVSEEMSGYADIPDGSNICESDEVYNSPNTAQDYNNAPSDDSFNSGPFVGHRTVTTAAGYPAPSHTGQGSSTGLGLSFDEVVPTSTRDDPWAPPGTGRQGPAEYPKFQERQNAAEYYSQERNTLLEYGNPGPLSMNFNVTVDTEDVALAGDPQFGVEPREQEQWTYLPQQYPYNTSLNSQHGYAEYSSTPNHGPSMQAWSPTRDSPFSYTSQRSGPTRLIGSPDCTAGQNLTLPIRDVPNIVHSTLVNIPGTSFATAEKQYRIGDSPELLTNFGQIASGYVGLRPEQMPMTDPAAVTAQSSRFDLRVQTATPVPRREQQDRQRKKHRQRRQSDMHTRQLLPSQRSSGAPVTTVGRQSGVFRRMNKNMQLVEGRIRTLTPEGREHAKKMRKQGVCDDCRRKKSKVRG